MYSDSDICRMCMSDSDIILHNIFNTARPEESIVPKIWDCLGLNVYFGDGLPSFICHQCLFKLDALHEFKRMCHTSNDHLSKQKAPQEDMEVATLVPVPRSIGSIVDGSVRTLEDEVNTLEDEVNTLDDDVNTLDDDVNTLDDDVNTLDDDDEDIDLDEDDNNYEGDIDDSLSRASSRISLRSSDGSDVEADQQSNSGSMVVERYSYFLHADSEILSDREEESLPLNEPLYVSTHTESISKGTGTVVYSGNGPISPRTALNSDASKLSVGDTRSCFSSDITKSKTDVFHKDRILSSVSNSEHNVLGKNSPKTKKKRKLHMEGKYVTISSQLMNKLPKDSGTSDIRNKSAKHSTTPTEVLENNQNEDPVNKHAKFLNETDKSPFEIRVKTETAVTVTNFKPHSANKSEIHSPQKCSSCGKKFLNKHYLKQHIEKHHRPSHSTYTCKVCSQQFISITNLELHMKRHSYSEPFQCKDCGKTYARSWQLDRHVNIHSNSNKYACEKCGKKFTSVAYVKKHMSLHNRIHACEYCKRVFTCDTYLKKHTSKHHTSSELSEVQCSEGEQIHGGQLDQDIERHCSAVNNKLYRELKAKTDKLSKYSRSAKHDWIMKEDKDMYEENGTRMHQCDYCGLLFQKIDELSDHEHKVHSQNKIYSCIVCLKVFTRQIYVKIHSLENKCV